MIKPLILYDKGDNDMVKPSKLWDKAHIEKVEETETLLGKTVCGARIPKPQLEEGENIKEFTKKFKAWEKMPFCINAPFNEGSNGRCEYHGGASTGAGKRASQFKEEVMEDEIKIVQTETLPSLIPNTDINLVVNEIQLDSDPYVVGDKILRQLEEKGYVVPIMIEPLLQSCDSCMYSIKCPFGKNLTRRCQYERRVIYETFAQIYKNNPMADPQLALELAINRAELYRTRIYMSQIGIEQASKKKITQEKKSLTSAVITLKREFNAPIGISQMGDGGDALARAFMGGKLDDSDIELIERRMKIKPKKQEIEVINDE